MRDYNYQPRAHAESHYHIRELIERQEKRSADRTYHQDVEKNRDERLKDIASAKNVELKPFWCVKCQADFQSAAVKTIDTWGDNAYYKTKHHPCGTWCMRNITDSWRDSYWTKSKGVNHGRGQHFADIVQPNETNYNLLYGKQGR